MFSRAAHRATAASEGRAAAQRQLAGSVTVTDRSGDPLDAYIKDLAAWTERTGFTVDAGKCLWCGKTGRLKTGSLPFIGALLYCPQHQDAYRTCKERQVHIDAEEPEPELKVHWRDAWGASSCGIGSKTTENPRMVTCKRCLAYHVSSSIPSTVVRFLKGR